VTKKREIRFRPIQHKKASETDYRRALRQLLRSSAALVRSDILPLVSGAKSAEIEVKNNSDVDFGLSVLEEAIRFRLTKTAQQTVQRILDTELLRHTEKFRQGVRAALGIDLGAVISGSDLADEMVLVSRRNAGLITNLGEDVIKRVSDAVSENVVKGRTMKDLKARLTKDFGFMDTRARLIARDQTAKFTGDLNRLRQDQAGIKEYEWGTSQDERVRDSHAAMEGKRCQWNNASVFRADGTGKFASRSSIGGVALHPGEDIQCRCVAYAVIRLD